MVGGGGEVAPCASDIGIEVDELELGAGSGADRDEFFQGERIHRFTTGKILTAGDELFLAGCGGMGVPVHLLGFRCGDVAIDGSEGDHCGWRDPNDSLVTSAINLGADPSNAMGVLGGADIDDAVGAAKVNLRDVLECDGDDRSLHILKLAILKRRRLVVLGGLTLLQWIETRDDAIDLGDLCALGHGSDFLYGGCVGHSHNGVVGFSLDKGMA